jgi:hypothetical protein
MEVYHFSGKKSPRDTTQKKTDCKTCTSNHIIYVHFYELIHLHRSSLVGARAENKANLQIYEISIKFMPIQNE